MPYMLLIIEPVGQRAERTEEEGRALYEKMMRFGADLQARGLLIAGESLHTTARGARVQVRGGKTSVIDGPFSEAKEMVGGFFMLSTDSRDEAIDIARQCPAAEWSTVEVRSLGPCFEG